MTTTADVPKMLKRYAKAWADHDVEAIMMLHAVDCVFHLHDGTGPAEGRNAVRAAFEQLFASFPDLAMTQVRSTGAGNLVISEYVAIATPAGCSVPFAVEAVDLIELVDGLVARKDTYLDTAAIAKVLGLF